MIIEYLASNSFLVSQNNLVSFRRYVGSLPEGGFFEIFFESNVPEKTVFQG